MKRPIYPVVVHGIPTSFNPVSPDHLRMLEAMNPDTFKTPPLFVKWISQQSVQRGTSQSSIRIGFSSLDQANEAVKNKIFYGRFNKQTEHGRATKARFMNCLQDGHTSKHCKEPGLCPYCAENHPADTCELKGKMTSTVPLAHDTARRSTRRSTSKLSLRQHPPASTTRPSTPHAQRG